MKNEKNYYLGLDIGTDSVGYAVTNEEYDLLKFKGEPMWGTHLFEAGNLNDKRRAFRTARRRLDRRQQRVKLVQEIFAEEIAKVDENFYRRIKESFLWRDDANDAHSLFCDEEFTDKEYYKQYPTIHHLISELIHNPEAHDIRLVYIACAWLVAHRGHFFSEVSKENISELLDVNKSYTELMSFFTVKPWECDADEFGKILKKKAGVTAKYKELCKLLFSSNKAPKTEAIEDEPYYSVEHILKLICGGSVSAKDLFNNEDYSEISSFSLDKADDELAEVFAALGDDAELVRLLKKLYDWSVLADILSDSESESDEDTIYISDKKIKIYNKHKADLKLLKRFVKKYAPDKYRECFRNENAAGYASYLKSGKPTVSENFYKYLNGIFKNVTPDESDEREYSDMMARIEAKSFCPKQVTSDNRVIPYQVYWIELKHILDNASAYLPFLNERDADGYTSKEKLLSIMEFRVPYFVGPLNKSSKEFSWFERKSEGRIYPWNFKDMVDYEASEEAFIRKMTNACTYLPYAPVLPKCSLLHEKFQVLNEINALSVNGKRIPVDVKQRIYTELFMTRKKVTKKSIRDYLLVNNVYGKSDLETLGGIDDTVKSGLSSYHAFKNLLNARKLTDDDVESIILRRTYTEDKHRFAEWINKNYPNLSAADKQYVSNLKFKDFARLSKELLCDVYGTETSSETTGEALSIIDRMWNENLNLMEILSDRFTYRSIVEAQTKEYYREKPQSIDERMKEMYISNSVKRSIIRTLDIVDDVVKANGQAPKKIFVEMARGGKPEEKGKRTQSRYAKLKELYAKCTLEDAREMEKQLDNMGSDRDRKLQGEKLFLYYLQLGRSMYSNTPIDIEHLSDKTYDIDHIYPQSKVKDDSVWNNKVLVLSKENGEKGDKYPISEDVHRKMSGWWKLLLDNELITPEKYKRLVRNTQFDANEEWGFINRQLVETRQSTKAVATLLTEKYPDTKIVYVKAGTVSEFRQEFDMLKSRSVNDLHHAKDAYLNIVVGNVYDEQFKYEWFLNNRDKYNLKISTLFSRRVTVGDSLIWNGNESISKVKNIIHNKNAIHLTRYSFCRKGGFFDQNPLKKSKNLIPLKNGLDTEKYGGYNKSTASFFVITKYHVGKKSEVMMMPVELMKSKNFISDEGFACEYAKETIGKIIGKTVEHVEFPLGMRKIKINTMLDFDGMRMCVAGKANGGQTIIVSMNVPLLIEYKWQSYIKAIEKFVEKKKEAPSMPYNRNFDIVSKEDNHVLYEEMTKKLSNNLYIKRPANPIQCLIDGKEKFDCLDIFEQCKCLLQIVALFGRASGGCNLN